MVVYTQAVMIERFECLTVVEDSAASVEKIPHTREDLVELDLVLRWSDELS